MPTAIPNQGYLFVAGLKNPWGESVGAIDTSAMHTRTPGKWKMVVSVWEPRQVNGQTLESRYRVGDAVYVPQASEPMIMAEKTVGLILEGDVKAVIKAGDYEPVFDETGYTINALKELAAADEQAIRPRIAMAN